MSNNIIRKLKNMDLIKDGTDGILQGLDEDDKFFILALTSDLIINKPQTVTKKIVENFLKEIQND